MGCDIHLHVEIKVDDEWLHYSYVDVGRNYRLFGYMAGVRSTFSEPIVDPKGFPDDATKVTRIDAEYWGVDAHTHSWLSSEEVHELTRIVMDDPDCKIPRDFQCCDMFGYFFGNSYAGFIDYPDERRRGIQDFRFVFWFDN